MHHAKPATPAAPIPENPGFLRGLAWLAIAGCAIFTAALLIGDVVVPDHDWIADTISDLGAGEYEWIADIGIYGFSLGLIALAAAASHAHLGGKGWTLGVYGLLVTGLIVFLVGARNEYGDADQDGTVIHIYLVYALGVTFAVMPWAMSEGAARMGDRYGWACKAATVLWVVMAPIFFFLPTDIDGLYERVLGGVTFIFVIAVALALLKRARAVSAFGTG
ncbi:DUF998 domain-containing protein [Jannaschia sp. W003]|uniref:DUF998 domain-containing protein n=1 Tax=Jannaschia sp. W003 TaxID=2867012 RepID=UPI0021A26A83|nr:DUF998 domain-containing protein [Jannaschia sp. W003]UWQ20668.1 DUF998 domain-containing protein [Jannaschia sp. W003]